MRKVEKSRFFALEKLAKIKIGLDRPETFFGYSPLTSATAHIKILVPASIQKITKNRKKNFCQNLRTFFGKIAVTQKLCFKSKFWHQVIFSS